MTAVLTYHLRSGRLSTIACGKVFYLPVYQESRIFEWEKRQELPSGKFTLWDHCFERPDQQVSSGASIPNRVPAGEIIYRVNPRGTSALEVIDYPGYYAKRFEGEAEVSGASHTQFGKAVYVGDRRGGLYLHGWPPCHLKQCVVVMHNWEDAWQAIAAEPELSFSIAY